MGKPMRSGIFAVVSIGAYRLYVGEVHHIKTRWRSLLADFEAGRHPDPHLQQTWNRYGKQRRFTFHTAQDLKDDIQLLERHRFLEDAEIQV